MKLQFKTDPDLSFLRACAVVATSGRAVDPKIEQATREAALVINERLDLAELNLQAFWQAMVGLGTIAEEVRVERSLLAAGCAELGVDSLAPAVRGRLADARLAFREQFPKLADQLPLRARPLKELWEASGPGTLKEIGRRTVAKLIPPRVTVHLIQPVRGGDGGLLMDIDAVWMEAVLSNPHPAIPETLRVAWLVARKGLDRGEPSQLLTPVRWSRAAALALVPIVLSAAEELGTCEASEANIAIASQLWIGEGDVTQLLNWWKQMRERELPLPVAIKALDKMMTEE